MHQEGERSFKELEVLVPWGTIHGKLYGPEDAQPILFLHGWQDNAGSFDPLIALLPDELAYLAIDFPGHGFSSPFPQGQMYYIFWDALLAVRRLVKQFGWKKITIVGHSLGGAVGFMYASAFPDEINKLVCLDIVCPRVAKPSTIAAQFGDMIDKFHKYETFDLDKQPMYDYEEMVNTALDGYKGMVNRKGIEILLKRGMRKIDNGKYVFCRDLRLKVAGLGMPSLDVVMEMAQRVTCHYLNIRAMNGIIKTMESPEIYPLVMDKLKETCASFSFHEVPGAHHVHLNNPEVIAPIISRFLVS